MAEALQGFVMTMNIHSQEDRDELKRLVRANLQEEKEQEAKEARPTTPPPKDDLTEFPPLSRS